MKNIIYPVMIILLAIILRFWQLGGNPPSLDWDEASLGYNAYSILKTGRDEYGSLLPLSIQSFGDYKPPLYTYFAIIPVAIFGLNEFATRFISAFFGSLTVLVSYFLMNELFPRRSRRWYWLFLLLFSISPWHIQFSRVAFEANLALFFFLTGIWLFLKGLQRSSYFIFSFLSFGLSIYGYHSSRLVIPILLAGLTLLYWKEIKTRLNWFMLAVIISFIFVTPVILQLNNSTSARFGSVTLINPSERLGVSIKDIEQDKMKGDRLGTLMHNRRVIYAKDILAGYLDHFNFDFLFLTGDAAGRHHAQGMGMLYLWDFPFLIIGILTILKEKNKSLFGKYVLQRNFSSLSETRNDDEGVSGEDTSRRSDAVAAKMMKLQSKEIFQTGSKGMITLFLWFLTAPISSALTKATPHAVRSLLYLPSYQIFISAGLLPVFIMIRNKLSGKSKIFSYMLPLLLVINFYYYLHMYWIHTPVEEAQWWQYGYKQTVEEAYKPEYTNDRVLVTYQYDQPYIYFLFYGKVDPGWYQKNWGKTEIRRDERKIGKFEFRKIDWEKDSKLADTLIIGTPREIPPDAPGLVKEIRFPDGSVAFRISKR